MLSAILVVLLGFGIAAATYLALERIGRRVWVPLVLRGVAWSALGLLLLNLSCPVRGRSLRPLVLLDASLSLGAPGGRWAAARDSARRWGEVRTFGDERGGQDSLPSRGRSLLAPALIAASASDRPIVVVSDGEIEDVREVPPDILVRSGVRLFPRASRPDLVISRVEGPRRITAGDSIPLDIQVQAYGPTRRDTISVQVFAGDRRLARKTLRLPAAAPAGPVCRCPRPPWRRGLICCASLCHRVRMRSPAPTRDSIWLLSLPPPERCCWRVQRTGTAASCFVPSGT